MICLKEHQESVEISVKPNYSAAITYETPEGYKIYEFRFNAYIKNDIYESYEGGEFIANVPYQEFEVYDIDMITYTSITYFEDDEIEEVGTITKISETQHKIWIELIQTKLNEDFDYYKDANKVYS